MVLTCDLEALLLDIYPGELKPYVHTKNLHAVIAALSVNLPEVKVANLEVSKMSFNNWLDKQTVVHPSDGIFFSNKKKWAIKAWEEMEETYAYG